VIVAQKRQLLLEEAGKKVVGYAADEVILGQGKYLFVNQNSVGSF